MSDSSDSRKSVDQSGEISRRSFLKGAGLTSLGLALTSGQGLINEVEAKENSPQIIPTTGVEVTLQINGKAEKLKVQPHQTLNSVIRDRAGLTGTKISCDRGACGACTVILGGQTVNSCMTLALDAVGKPIETVEGLENNGQLHPVQECFVKHDALQCGFCTPGMVMSCKNLLDKNPNPTEDDVRHAVQGNLCRCGTYPKVFKATVEAAQKSKKKGG